MQRQDQPKETFSKRYGIRPPEPEDLIRDEAPEGLRSEVLNTAVEDCGVYPSRLREIVCRILLRRPDPQNGSEYPNIWCEVEGLVYGECEWYQFYDFVERLHALLEQGTPEGKPLEDAFNDACRQLGVGWELRDGLVQMRGGEGFDAVVRTAAHALDTPDRTTAKEELGEAIGDLSRRPQPDLSGAVHHAMAALECVMKQVSGDGRKTMGQMLKAHPELAPPPLDDVLHKCWGYASENARHGNANRQLDFRTAEFIVGLSAVLVTFMNGRSLSPET